MQYIPKIASEAIGTYCLVFAGCGAVVVGDLYGTLDTLGIGLIFGLIVMAMIYSIGDISGAHINPAVTIAFWLAKRFEGKLVAPYVVAQIIGAILAAYTLHFLFLDHETLGSTIPSGTWQQSFILEFLLTAILMFVVLRVSSKGSSAGVMAGTAIGATVAVEAIFAGPVSGASMNPARSIGPALASQTFDHLWIYIVATILGALFAVALNWVIQWTPNDEGESKPEN